MRFAWLQKQAAPGAIVSPGGVRRLTLAVYNLVWWLPIVLVLTGTIDYGTGFVAFAAVTAIRLCANWYRTNFLTLEQAGRFPFRAP